MPGVKFRNWNAGSTQGGGGSGLVYNAVTFNVSNIVEDDYIGPSIDDGTTGSRTCTSGTIYLHPVFLHNVRADAIGAQVSAAVAATTIHYGIYDTVSARDDRPNSLVESGSASSATTGVKETSFTATTFNGRYWLAILATGGSPSAYGADFTLDRSRGGTVAPIQTTFGSAFSNIYMTATGKSSLPATITWSDFSGNDDSSAQVACSWLKNTRSGV